MFPEGSRSPPSWQDTQPSVVTRSAEIALHTCAEAGAAAMVGKGEAAIQRALRIIVRAPITWLPPWRVNRADLTRRS